MIVIVVFAYTYSHAVKHMTFFFGLSGLCRVRVCD